MAYWHECPNCGGSLDPGETCDCQREAKEVRKIADSNSNLPALGTVETKRRTAVVGVLIGQRV